VRRVAKALGVSRSQLHERLRHGLQRRGRYEKADDASLLQSVHRLVDERPTYGYRRIGVLLNRERLRAGLPRLNHKRMYRLMAQNGLLLQRYTGKPPGRAHDGQIITIRSNLRWTSDCFERQRQRLSSLRHDRLRHRPGDGSLLHPGAQSAVQRNG
jgi:hypothetical protein